MAARSLAVVKIFEYKWSRWRSPLRECVKYMPTGAMRITPPQPLLSLVARVTLPRLVCSAERHVAPGARRLKRFFCCSNQLGSALAEVSKREFSWVINQFALDRDAAR